MAPLNVLLKVLEEEGALAEDRVDEAAGTRMRIRTVVNGRGIRTLGRPPEVQGVQAIQASEQAVEWVEAPREISGVIHM